MGSRIKEEIRQCLLINTLPKNLKQKRMENNEDKNARENQDDKKVWCYMYIEYWQREFKQVEWIGICGFRSVYPSRWER